MISDYSGWYLHDESTAECPDCNGLVASKYPGELEKLLNEIDQHNCPEEDEPEIAEYDPGPEIDDQGGMSEIQFMHPE